MTAGSHDPSGQGYVQPLILLALLKAQQLPFATLLGIELVTADADRIVGQMTVRSEFCTLPAVLLGGAIMAFADTLGALATVAK